MPAHRIEHPDVLVRTPLQAYGVEADITMFVGLDAESWSMKAERIPWIDDSVRIQLGLTDGDLPSVVPAMCSNHYLIPANRRYFLKRNMMNQQEIRHQLLSIFQK